MSNFTFGLDPEFMIISKAGKVKSAIGIVPGTKEKRYKKSPNEFYYDNVLAECAIKPAKSKDEAVANIKKALQQLAEIVNPHKVFIQSSIEYPKAELMHEDAFKIGCDPEYCAYSLQEIRPPEDTFERTNLRSAGGHIHIGCEFAAKDWINAYQTVRMMDLFVGLPSVLLDNNPASIQRKKLYGRAGRFRRPPNLENPYGIEYRTLSNFWLQSPKHVELIYDLCQFVVDFLNRGDHNALWTVDIDKLMDDKSWLEDDFTPASCHHCIGYDVTTLRHLIDNIDFAGVPRVSSPFKIFRKFAGEDLLNRVQELEEVADNDLYKQWSIK